MTASPSISAYRCLLREFNKSSISPRGARNTQVRSHLRALFEAPRKDAEHQVFLHDIQNAVTFSRSHREHKVLLERYNPWAGLSDEEKRHKTARRVGLDMPVTHKPEEDK